MWPSFRVGPEAISAISEFYLGNDEPAVTVHIPGAAVTLSGTVSATVEGEPVASLEGASVIVTSGGVEVRRVAVNADGTYDAGLLFASETPDYALAFVPPAGVVLAETQPENAAFSLLAGEESVASHKANRAFALIAEATTPDPELEPTPDPGTPPTSSADGVTVRLASGSTNNLEGFRGMSEEELNQILAMAASGRRVPITNDQSQLLGFAQRLSPEQLQQAVEAQARAFSETVGVNADPPSVAIVNVGAAISAARPEYDMEYLKSLLDLTQSMQQQARNDAASWDAFMQSALLLVQQDRVKLLHANMYSTPVDIGSVQLNDGVVTGAFDLSGVAPGEHHLVLHYEGTGITTISKATVSAGTEGLADTGSESTRAAWAAVLSFTVLGAVALVAARIRRRSHAASHL